MAKRELPYMQIYFDDLDALAPLSDEECGRLLRALLKYGRTAEEPELTGNERFLYPAFKAKIDSGFSEYEKKCEQNKRNIKKRWGKSDTTVYSGIQSYKNDTTVYDGKNRIRNAPREENNINNIYGGKNAQRFIPPTVGEVKKYCEERNNSIDANTFVDFYASKGWYVGKNKMKDWKAAVRTWAGTHRGRGAEKAVKEMTVEDWFRDEEADR